MTPIDVIYVDLASQGLRPDQWPRPPHLRYLLVPIPFGIFLVKKNGDFFTWNSWFHMDEKWILDQMWWEMNIYHEQCWDSVKRLGSTIGIGKVRKMSQNGGPMTRKHQWFWPNTLVVKNRVTMMDPQTAHDVQSVGFDDLRVKVVTATWQALSFTKIQTKAMPSNKAILPEAAKVFAYLDVHPS